MFQGWRVRVACLKPGENVSVPSTEFRNWDASFYDTSFQDGKFLDFEIELGGKFYKLSAYSEHLEIKRLA